MAIWTPLILKATRRLVNDPRVRAKAAELLEREVKPRAQEAWQKAKPKLKAAQEDLRTIAEETHPRQNPKGFAKKVKERFVDRRPRR